MFRRFSYGTHGFRKFFWGFILGLVAGILATYYYLQSIF